MRSKPKRNILKVVSGDPPATSEQRIFCRFAMNNVPMRYKDLRVGDRGACVCRDFSGGGAGVQGVSEMKEETPLEMWFDLPDGQDPMHLLGRVSWSRQEGDVWRSGISFERQKLTSLGRVMKLGNV